MFVILTKPCLSSREALFLNDTLISAMILSSQVAIVRKFGKVLSTGHSRRLQKASMTMHAEMFVCFVIVSR
jgi:tRNA(Arg) A34 adenosine deaminase TadA